MPKTWSDAIAYYEGVRGKQASGAAATQAMQRLCRQVAESPLAAGLFVTTSMFDLCITQAPVDDVYRVPHLKVSLLRDGRLEFRYIDTMVRKDQWNRAVEPSDALPRLLAFLDQLHWFPPEMLKC